MDTLLHAALSNAVVVAVLAPIVTVFGRVSRRPALVHSLWLLVLLKLFTPPLWPMSLSWLVRSDAGQVTTNSTAVEPGLPAEPVDTVSQGALPEEGADGVAEETASPTAPAAASLGPAPALSDAPPAPKPLTLPEASNPAATATSFPLSWQSSLLTIWLSGSLLWLALAGYRLYRFHRLLRLTQRAPAGLHARVRHLADRLGLARCPGVWVVPAPVSPLLWALVGEPRLLVPASLLERLTEEQWDTLLAHELAHLRRGDHWVRILELAVLALYWWHPAVWWARRQLREAEEQCCDAWVVWTLPGAAEVYATALVEAVTYLSGARSALPLAASGIGHMHLLKRRLTMIMRGTTPRGLSAAGSLAVLGLAAVLLPLYPTWARTEQRPQGAGEQQTGGGTATTASRPGGADDASAPSPGAGAQDQPGSGAPVGGLPGGTGGTGGRRLYGPGGTGDGRQSTETVEDAQDEVDLLRVQLDLRRAERREVEARLRQARSIQQRYSQLVAGRAADRSELDNASTEVEVQEARLAAKDAQIKEAELRLKQAERRLANLRGQAPGSRERGFVRPGGSGPFLGGGVPFSGAPGGPTAPRGSGTAGPSGSAGTAPRGPGASGTISGSSTGQNFGGAGSFSGGIGGLGGGIGGGLSGGIGGLGGGFGGMGPGLGSAASFDLRLREVEKKLQSLIDEMKALRKEQRTDKPQSGTTP